MYPIGIDSKYLNPRNLDLLFQKSFHLLAAPPVGISFCRNSTFRNRGLQRSTRVGIDGKRGFTMK